MPNRHGGFAPYDRFSNLSLPDMRDSIPLAGSWNAAIV
jgi:hypothetical protein